MEIGLCEGEFSMFWFFCVCEVLAQTTGTSTVTVTIAQTATAAYAPKNILAIWVEDNFIPDL